MSALLARPPNHPETRSATCEAVECQISPLKLNSKQLWPKCYFAHWTQHGGAAVGPDRPALTARHSGSIVCLSDRKDAYEPLVCWAQLTGK